MTSPDAWHVADIASAPPRLLRRPRLSRMPGTSRTSVRGRAPGALLRDVLGARHLQDIARATVSPWQTSPPRLGGMALRNGLFVHGPTHWAAAVRAPDGGIRVASGSQDGALRRRHPRAGGARRRADVGDARDPPAGQARAARGAARVREPERDRAVDLDGRARRPAPARRGVSPAAVEALASALAVLPALAMLRSSSLARYHGAEHKTIGAYESGGDAHDEAKEHDRCGSHLVTPLVALSAGGQRARLAGPAASTGRPPARAPPWPRWGSPSSCSAGRRATRRTRWPGHSAAPGTALQRAIGTREPIRRGAGRARAPRSIGSSPWRAERSAHGHDHLDRTASRSSLRLTLILTTLFGIAQVLGGIWLALRRARSPTPRTTSPTVSPSASRSSAASLALRGAAGTRTFGWGRVEILAALVNGLTLVGLGVLIAIEAIVRLERPAGGAGRPGVILFGLAGIAVNGAAVVAMVPRRREPPRPQPARRPAAHHRRRGRLGRRRRGRRPDRRVRLGRGRSDHRARRLRALHRLRSRPDRRAGPDPARARASPPRPRGDRPRAVRRGGRPRGPRRPRVDDHERLRRRLGARHRSPRHRPARPAAPPRGGAAHALRRQPHDDPGRPRSLWRR